MENNRYYKLSEIKVRHFWERGKLCGIPEKEISKIFHEIVVKSDELSVFIKNNLNDDFSKDISEPILQNIMKKTQELKTFVVAGVNNND